MALLRRKWGDLKRLYYALLLAAAAGLQAETFYLTIAGLGGEAEYEQRFAGWASDLDKIFKSEPSSQAITFSGSATRANIEAKLGDLAKQAKPEDHLVLLLIGHGSFDEADYKFNIPGPDITATELASLLDKNPGAAGGRRHDQRQRRRHSNTKTKRVLITATKAGTEKNATVFPRYFIEGLRDPAADADKNEVITVLEAFRYAEAKTAKFYEEAKRLSTEHPLLEDTGKGDGVKAPALDNGEGMVAGMVRASAYRFRGSDGQGPRKAKASQGERGPGGEDRRTQVSQGVDARGRIPRGVDQVSVGFGQGSGGARQMTRRSLTRLLPMLFLPLLPGVGAGSGHTSRCAPQKPCATRAIPTPAPAISA